jgi:hypothetical protein
MKKKRNKESKSNLTFKKLKKNAELNLRLARLAYQPPANSTFISEQTSH